MRERTEIELENGSKVRLLNSSPELMEKIITECRDTILYPFEGEDEKTGKMVEVYVIEIKRVCNPI